jgi:hypothetical protein
VIIEFKKEMAIEAPSYFTTIDRTEVEFSRSQSHFIAFNMYCEILESNYGGDMPGGVIYKTEMS